MKIRYLNLLILLTFFLSNTASASLIKQYLNDEINAPAIAQLLLKDPAAFESNIDKIHKEVQSLDLNNLEQNKIKTLERTLTQAANQYNRDVKNYNMRVRVGGFIVGALVSGGIAYNMISPTGWFASSGKAAAARSNGFGYFTQQVFAVAIGLVTGGVGGVTTVWVGNRTYTKSEIEFTNKANDFVD